MSSLSLAIPSSGFASPFVLLQYPYTKLMTAFKFFFPTSYSSAQTQDSLLSEGDMLPHFCSSSLKLPENITRRSLQQLCRCHRHLKADCPFIAAVILLDLTFIRKHMLTSINL